MSLVPALDHIERGVHQRAEVASSYNLQPTRADKSLQVAHSVTAMVHQQFIVDVIQLGASGHFVKPRERFWVKAQPYSLAHMLAGDSLAPQFVGGTVYQAFLSALSYHRWHSPVSGTVTKAYVQPGTYYSEAPAEGYDPAGPNDSQGYITGIAARVHRAISPG
jgi:hypothetical protein